MKRSELARRTPLRRTPKLQGRRLAAWGILQREHPVAVEKALNVPYETVQPLVRVVRRSQLNPKSKKRRARDAAMRAARHVLTVRDTDVCRLAHVRHLGACMGPLDPHHLLKQSAGGTEDPDGLVWLCRLHNGWVEDWPDVAHELGLVARHGETVADCWLRLHEHGLAVRPEPSPRRFVVDRGMPEMMCACGRRSFGEFCGACFGEASQW